MCQPTLDHCSLSFSEPCSSPFRSFLASKNACRAFGSSFLHLITAASILTKVFSYTLYLIWSCWISYYFHIFKKKNFPFCIPGCTIQRRNKPVIISCLTHLSSPSDPRGSFIMLKVDEICSHPTVTLRSLNSHSSSWRLWFIWSMWLNLSIGYTILFLWYLDINTARQI